MTIRLTLQTEPGTPFDSAELQRFIDLAVEMRGVHGVIEAVEQHVLVAELSDGSVTVSDDSRTDEAVPTRNGVDHLVSILIGENQWTTHGVLRALSGYNVDTFNRLVDELVKHDRVVTRQNNAEREYAAKVIL
jgi:hypothetical protein